MPLSPALANCDPADVAHWNRIRAQLAAGNPPAERRPMPTLAEQADRQIAILASDAAKAFGTPVSLTDDERARGVTAAWVDKKGMRTSIGVGAE